MNDPTAGHSTVIGMARVEAARARVRWGWTTAGLLAVCFALVGLLTWWLGWWPLAILGLSFVVAVSQYVADHSAELRAMQAVPADPRRYAALMHQVNRLSALAGVPAPAVYVSPKPVANAFAIRTAGGATVCVTS
ncbi:MAG: hypothetical protein M3440_08490, partial [Chloroflexota bacterium]|nr:hypothetical protein [Chloroflexota bacterium]